MTLSVEVRFLLDRFEGSDGHDADAPEWPPSPARVFMALVAGCAAEAEEALRWLEQQGPPTVAAGASAESRSPERWLVTNKTHKKGGNATYPGRTNVSRQRVGRSLESSKVTYSWRGAAPTAETVEVLDEAARNVGYVGRPTSPAILRVTTGDEAGHEMRWEPTSQRGLEGVDLRLPYPGFFDALVDAYQTEDRVEPPVYARYGRVDAAAPRPETVVESPWSELLVLELDTEGVVPGAHAVALAAAVRREATRRLAERLGEDAVHPVLTGYDQSGHLAWLPLPFTGYEHADGRILGVGLALPRDVAEQALRQLRDVLQDGAAWRLEVASPLGGGPLRLGFDAAVGHQTWTSTPARWTLPSRVWRTALPAVLDVAPRRELSEEEAVTRSVTNAGLPTPVAVQVERGPLTSGDVSLRPRQTVRRHGDRPRPFRHARLVFSEPVHGPVIFGAMRHFGLGLCTQEDGGLAPSSGEAQAGQDGETG
jgi:CRISPR-associated protein Csb2